MAILAGKLSWFYFQLLLPSRQGERVLLNLSLTIYIGLISNFLGWPFLFSFDALYFASGEGVSGLLL